MTIEVDVSGRRYIEDRRTAEVLAGSQSRETSFTEHWTFALDGDPPSSRGGSPRPAPRSPGHSSPAAWRHPATAQRPKLTGA